MAHGIPIVARVGEWEVVRTISEGAYLAAGTGGRQVVLKRLGEDCLMRGRLHPSIKERLERVSQLAHGGVANLHGVQRDPSGAYLIWDYVEGRTFEEYAREKGRPTRELLGLGREVALQVEAMHGLGIVHGAIHGRNVIVDKNGGVRLTHVSPLLYQDTGEDVAGIIRMLEEALEEKLGMEKNISLRELGRRLAELIQGDAEKKEERELEPAEEARGRMVWMAVGVTILAVLGGWMVWSLVVGQ